MTGKSVVDDYYSSLSSSESGDKKSSQESVKPKLKAKKIIKKVEPKKIPVVEEEAKDTITEKTVKKPVLKKKIVQSMEVVKEEKKQSFDKPSFSEKSQVKRPSFKKPVDSDSVSTDNQNRSKKTYKKSNHHIVNNKDDDFDDDKKWWKKSKLKPFAWKRRKFNFFKEEEKEVTFTRATRNTKKKKEEKKVEDIKQNLVDRTWETVVVSDILSLKELSEKTWIPLPKLIAEFMKNGMMVNINTKIDFDSSSIVCEAFDITLKKDDSSGLEVEDLMEWDISALLVEEDNSKLKSRPPVISIMWHVDHWKTSLLDYIRSSKVASWEAGWITQSIWAYQVEQNWQKITFLDTPGHEAFTVMRARWAKSTDIAILVVAADEWVKPQTIESISHAKEADIPVIVAINKMDKQWANPDHVKWQLAEHGLTPEDWGGDTPMVPVSAHTGFGIDNLLEIILLVAEMKELKANPDRPWVATVIESHLDKNLWPVTTVLINTWTVNKTDNIVCNESYGKVKVMKNHENKAVLKAFPWDPILIVWLDKVVSGWNILQVVSSSQKAREKAIEYNDIMLNKKAQRSSGLDVLMSKIKAWNLKQLKIVVKADTNGSLEAIKWALVKLSTPETTVDIIHSWVGAITEWDVLMCEWSSAILVSFGVWVVWSAQSAIKDTQIEFISSEIIYHITERIEKIVTWMLDPKEVEVVLCMAKVWGVFFTDKKFMILGLILSDEDSKIESNTQVRVIRKKNVIWHWEITSLKKWVEEVKKLEWPTECGIRFEWNLVVEEGDELEVYKIEIEK